MTRTKLPDLRTWISIVVFVGATIVCLISKRDVQWLTDRNSNHSASFFTLDNASNLEYLQNKPASRELQSGSSVGYDAQSVITATAETSNEMNLLLKFLLPTDPSVHGLKKIENGLFLADGITARMIALAGHPVPLANGLKSEIPFHARPDGAQIFEDPRAENTGGYIYVSNCELENAGGVGAITFNKYGNAIEYKRLLSGTTTNCNGGKTHFGAWISCEEDFQRENGKAWQVDPTGARAPTPISLGSDGGVFEAFAYDTRDPNRPRFFLTEDKSRRPLRRWTPSEPQISDPWELLLGEGVTDYLLLFPESSNPSMGTFSWTTNKDTAKNNAHQNYPNSEGIDVSGNILAFVSKTTKSMFELNLDSGSYVRTSTSFGLFDGQPDIIRNILSPDSDGAGGNIMYFCEDGGSRSGIHARDSEGNFYTVAESSLFQPETTGLAISPDGRRIYFAFQNDGILFELQRTDGKSFSGATVNLKAHSSDMTDEKRRRSRQLFPQR